MCRNVNLEKDNDGRWLAEVPDLPGVLVYGLTPHDAIAKVKWKSYHDDPFTY
jgi:predicted RNase H-like HicB family nuclease